MPNEQRTVTLEVFRYLPDQEEQPRFQTYSVPYREDWVVLDALNYIKDHVDGTLSYRWSCRMGVCGSCGMMVNGEPKLTCAAFLKDYYPNPIRVEPIHRGPPHARRKRHGAIHGIDLPEGERTDGFHLGAGMVSLQERRVTRIDPENAGEYHHQQDRQSSAAPGGCPGGGGIQVQYGDWCGHERPCSAVHRRNWTMEDLRIRATLYASPHPWE